jgi:DNA-binding transcriptional ArsR family regulator
VIEVILDGATIARIRFAVSPIFETAGWLALTATKQAHPSLGRPAPADLAMLGDRDVAVAATLVLGCMRHRAQDRYVPDFLTPNPSAGSVRDVLAQQFAQVHDADASVVRDQIARQRRTTGIDSPTIRRLADSGRLAHVVATGLEKFWRAAVAQRWPRVERATRNDVTNRAVSGAATGTGDMLNGLHPTVAWAGNTLHVDRPYDRIVPVYNQEIVLQPCVLPVPRVAIQFASLSASYVAYPVHPDPRPKAPTTLNNELLGFGRTAVLQALSDPSTTTELAKRTGLAASTVSHHLRVLLDAGLLTKGRHGKHVIYERTPAAHTLVAASPAERLDACGDVQ